MSTWKFGQFQAREGKGAELAELLLEIARRIRSSEGSRSCRLLAHTEDTARFAILEEWDGIEAHKASVRENATEDLRGRFAALVAEMTASDYFEG